VSDLPQCPTPCDDDCELRPDGCHEEHQVPGKRGHQPHGCQDIRVAIGAAAARAAAAEREQAVRQALENERQRMREPVAVITAWAERLPQRLVPLRIGEMLARLRSLTAPGEDADLLEDGHG